MPTRREALRAMGASAALPILPLAQAQPDTATPAFFHRDELDVLAQLVDFIIPRTGTPGAADARVHFLIDEEAARNAGLGQTLRQGIAALIAADFLKLTPDRRTALLTRFSQSGSNEERQFFKTLKDRTIDGYYSTREGLETELGYKGSVPLASFPGCTHPEHQRLD